MRFQLGDGQGAVQETRYCQGSGTSLLCFLPARIQKSVQSSASPATLAGRSDDIQILQHLLTTYKALHSTQAHGRSLGWIDTLAVADEVGLNAAEVNPRNLFCPTSTTPTPQGQITFYSPLINVKQVKARISSRLAYGRWIQSSVCS